MPWTESNYPAAMKNLPAEVRRKAIEIANALFEQGRMEEGLVIATAIKRAKEWAAKNKILYPE
jgi:uncharacterized protein YdaT